MPPIIGKPRPKQGPSNQGPTGNPGLDQMIQQHQQMGAVHRAQLTASIASQGRMPMSTGAVDAVRMQNVPPPLPNVNPMSDPPNQESQQVPQPSDPQDPVDTQQQAERVHEQVQAFQQQKARTLPYENAVIELVQAEDIMTLALMNQLCKTALQLVRLAADRVARQPGANRQAIEGQLAVPQYLQELCGAILPVGMIPPQTEPTRWTHYISGAVREDLRRISGGPVARHPKKT